MHVRAAPVLVAILLCASAASCGKREAVDRTCYTSVYEAAMQAVADRDLKALWPLLTERGRENVERHLRAWQAGLSGPFLLERIRERRGEVDADEIELARHGTIEDVWRFFLEADPRPARPPQKGLRIAPDAKTVTIDYADPTGTIRSVRLIQTPTGWYVDDLQL